LTTPEAEFTNQSRKDRVQGPVMVTLIVDAHGMPQNLRILKPLPAGLSEAAIAAVQRYRFKPALKDGDKPVPVMITIVVNFKLY
jgi:periplasmic protein TonB